MFAEENAGAEDSENGCLDLLAEVAMTQEEVEEDLQAPQSSEDKCEEDLEACEEVEEGEEGPQSCADTGRAAQGFGKAGNGLRQQPSYLGKRKLEGAELQVWHPRQG